ncbi:SWIM zinc finger family protein [Streptomyces sp. T028]|uniref:SWIM zinc finger family protein n=1 Tax=Streptomyces sp. T028 TaxID=3394379 RepID=UPI003A861A95
MSEEREREAGVPAAEGAGERPADAARRALRAARERGSRGEAPMGAAGDVEQAGRAVAGRGDRGSGARDDAVPGTGAAAGTEPGPLALSPGDAARAALRHARSASASASRPSGPDTVGPGTPATVGPGTPATGEGASASPAAVSGPAVPGTPTPATRPSEPSRADTPALAASQSRTPVADTSAGKSPRPGARPGDIAREALRAARAQARRDAAEADAEAGERHAGRAHPAPGGAGAAGPVVPDAARVSAADSIARGRSRTTGIGTGDRKARERARLVRESLADAFRMPSDDDLPPLSADESRPAPATPPTPAPTHEPPPATPTPPAPTAHRHPAPTDHRHPASTAPAPHSPRSMAAPSRDGDHRRTFPAFAPLPVPGEGEEARFAETWWGHAWVAALEEGALDVKRLARGRGYAQQGNVDAITVTPGLVLAYVQGSRPRPYRVQVRLRTLGEEDWERFLDAAVDSPAHIAALLDKEMPESLADCGVPLLPGPGDLDPHCSCPDRAHPCKHAAALCYQTARLLDADPFVLLLLRGRGERELLDALSRRNATRAARAAQDQEPAPLPGVRASEAVTPRPMRQLPPLPAPLPVLPHPEQPPAYPSAPNGPDSFALDQLATDAAARAHALLVTGHDEIGELTLWQDAVRLAAARPGSGLTAATRALYAALAAAAGRTPSELARAVAAWRQGGPDGLTVLEEPWDPPAGRFDRARPLLLAADLPAFRPWRNHLTHPGGHVQLRFGRDGLWYPYESEPGHDDWWPRGTPDPDPVGALTGLGGTAEP